MTDKDFARFVGILVCYPIWTFTQSQGELIQFAGTYKTSRALFQIDASLIKDYTMLKFCISAVLFVFLFVVVVSDQSSEKLFPVLRGFKGRIVGGDETSITNHPYQASVQFFGFHYCGGAVISDRFVVTAAHCMAG